MRHHPDPVPANGTLAETFVSVSGGGFRQSTATVAPVEPGLDAVLERVSRTLRSPVVLFSTLDQEQDRLVAAVGLPVESGGTGEAPPLWAFCRRVRGAARPVMVADTLHDGGLDLPGPTEMRLVRSYAGVPVLVEDRVVGALCAVGTEPRRFDDLEMALLEVAGLAAARWLDPRMQYSPLEPAGPPLREDSGDVVVEGRWKLMSLVARGGQGEVWRAKEIGSGRDVALKLATAGLGAVIQEARAFAAMRHVNLVNIHAAGTLSDGREYSVMELVDGDPFLPLETGFTPALLELLIDRLAQVAGGLTAIHGAGFAHGDLKPANILVDRARDRVVLIDMGLGIRLGRPMRAAGGTPGVSAPEQFSRRLPAMTRQVDVYGLAVTAWQLLCGRGPFDDLASATAQIQAQREGRFTPISRFVPSLAALDPIFARALSPEPDLRQRTPLELALSLRDAIAGHPTFGDSHGISAAVLRAVLTAALPDDLDARLAARWMGRCRDLAAFLSPEEWVAFLGEISGGDPDVVRRVVRRSVDAGGRNRIRACRLAFETRCVVESFTGHFAWGIPFSRLAVLEVDDGSAMGTAWLPGGGPELLQAHFEAFFQGMIALAGADATVSWSRQEGERWLFQIRWSHVGQG